MPKVDDIRYLKLGKRGSFRLDSVPKHMVTILGWQKDDKLKFFRDGNLNALIVVNRDRSAPTFLTQALTNLDEEYKSHPKEYVQLLKRNLSKEGRELLADKQKWKNVSTVENPDEEYIRNLKQIVDYYEEQATIKENELTEANNLFNQARAYLKTAEFNYNKHRKKQGGKQAETSQKVGQ